MKLRRLEADYKKKKFLIEEEIFYASQGYEVWSYLYVYENGINTYDYLVKTVDIAMQQSNIQYDVPFDIWTELESVEEEP
jgi:hypothetical protein